MSFIAGRYTHTVGGSLMGQVQAGFNISHRHFKTLITGDNFADSPQDACFRGAEMFIQYDLMEYDAAGVIALIWPYDGVTLYSVVTEVGNFDVQNNLTLSTLLTAVANTPASATPATATFAESILAEGFDVSVLYAPQLRTVPIRQRIYLDDNGLFGTLT